MAKNEILKDIFRANGFVKSFLVAARGIFYLFVYHRNMRLIFILGILAFISGIYLKLKGIELVALCITITLVFMAEIFNTAIEMMMNVFTEKYNVKIKLIKDIAAGIVVLTCLNAIAVGYTLLLRKL